MDTVKFLLGATCALLLVAVVASWKNMTAGILGASPNELERISKQIAEIRAEQDKLRIEKQLIEMRTNAPQLTQPTPTASELEALRLQIEQEKQALAELEKENEEKEDKKLEIQEEGFMAQRDLYKKDKELARADLIAQAILVGRVSEYVQDVEIGSFITFTVTAPPEMSLDPDTIIALRRKTGILGKFKITEITADGGIAYPLPGFGEVQPQIGDELILPPPFLD